MICNSDFDLLPKLMETTEGLGGSSWANCYITLQYSADDLGFELVQGAYFESMGQNFRDMMQIGSNDYDINIKEFIYITTLN